MDIMSYMFDQDNVTRLYGIEQEKKGREEGRREYARITAINLLAMNMDITMIEKVTGLSQEEILKLKDEPHD